MRALLKFGEFRNVQHWVSFGIPLPKILIMIVIILRISSLVMHYAGCSDVYNIFIVIIAIIVKAFMTMEGI